MWLLHRLVYHLQDLRQRQNSSFGSASERLQTSRVTKATKVALRPPNGENAASLSWPLQHHTPHHKSGLVSWCGWIRTTSLQPSHRFCSPSAGGCQSVVGCPILNCPHWAFWPSWTRPPSGLPGAQSRRSTLLSPAFFSLPTVSRAYLSALQDLISSLSSREINSIFG